MMRQPILDGEARAGHSHGGHGHTHGVVDPDIAASEEGIRAVKWSFGLLALTAILQLAALYRTGSVALFADTIHNAADAATALPLWVAFMLDRKRPTRTFTYGLGRVEDLAGLTIVLIILYSALVAGHEALERLADPQPIRNLPIVALAGVVGLIGNALAAWVRIGAGRRINSAALIADGQHAAVDGLTSLAVVAGAAGTYLGIPLADPLIGLAIMLVIFVIVWQSARAVLTRLLDGVDEEIVHEIEHAARHVHGISQLLEIKARWLGHRLHADVAVVVDDGITLTEAHEIVSQLRSELKAHVPALSAAAIRFERLP